MRKKCCFYEFWRHEKTYVSFTSSSKGYAPINKKSEVNMYNNLINKTNLPEK